MATAETPEVDPVVDPAPDPAVDPPATPAAPAASAKTPQPREYIIFDAKLANDAILGRATTLSRDEALEAVVSPLPEAQQAGPFVALAAHYFKETTPTVEPPPPPKRTWS